MRTSLASAVWKLLPAGAFLCFALIGIAVMGCTPKTDPSFQQGQKIYQANCVACHGINGGGVLHSNTVLNNNALITGNPEPVVAAILFGKAGDGTMPSWQKQLNDKEVAAVATYIRQAWSNQATAVTVAIAAKIRAKKD
jgi:cytochrome c oxidase subunit II